MQCAGMRESTSRNQANGSTPDHLQDATKLRNTAAAPLRKFPRTLYSVFNLDLTTFPALFLGRADSKTISLGTN